MQWISSRVTHLRSTLALAAQALTAWRWRQVTVAAGVGVAVALLMGFATVLIPNSFFTRDIPPTWWDRPVWIITSLLVGLLAATYVRTTPVPEDTEHAAARRETARQERGTTLGMAGGFLAWFAVGCPVCNKIALLVLGYSGAMTWFAPAQPILAVLAMIFAGVAVIWRLKGQVVCALPSRSASATRATQRV